MYAFCAEVARIVQFVAYLDQRYRLTQISGTEQREIRQLVPGEGRVVLGLQKTRIR